MTRATLIPEPLKLIDCGPPRELSVMLMAPVRVPAVVGVKVTLIAQVEPGATLVPQVLLSE